MSELKRQMVSIDLLDENPDNPNVMSSREFDLLVANIESEGFIDPVYIRPTEGGRFRIVGGHHRYRAGKFLDLKEVPCTINDDPEFDEDREAFQLVRMNMIRGKLDPSKFVELYSKLAGKYADEVLQENFGFADENEFKKLVAATAKSLPKDMQDAFKKAAAEIKTVDGLANLLNTLFTKYGDTLPYGYMVFDYGGKQSVWLRSSKTTMDQVIAIGAKCRDAGKSLDDVLALLFEEMASGDLVALLQASMAIAPQVEIPDGFTAIPTKDALGLSESGE